MNGRKRTVQVKFYVTEEERKLIEEKMKLVPTSNMAAYLRKIAIDGYIIQVDHTDIKAMTAEIQKIGVNVNQIARRVNATGNAYKDVVFQIKRAANLQIILAPYKIDVVLQPHYPETLLHITRTKILPCKLIAQEYSVSSYENGSSSSSIWQA